MKKQLLLRCPPNEGTSHLHNPFAEIPPYQYTQSTFKLFSDEEIKDQAGKESLLEELQEDRSHADVGDDTMDNFAKRQVRVEIEFQRWTALTAQI